MTHHGKEVTYRRHLYNRRSVEPLRICQRRDPSNNSHTPPHINWDESELPLAQIRILPLSLSLLMYIGLSIPALADLRCASPTFLRNIYTTYPTAKNWRQPTRRALFSCVHLCFVDFSAQSAYNTNPL